MTSLRLISLRARLAPLEHLEHPVGDQEAADHVDRPEGDGDHQQHVVDHAVRRPDEQQAAEHDDAVDGVRAAHQRRVQRVRHLRDHLEADERRQYEDGDLRHEIHQRSTTFPSRTTQAPATTSSSKSNFSSSRLRTLRAYSEEACSAISEGRLSGVAMLTPPSVRYVSPRRASSQLRPTSPARSTITLPGFMSSTALAGISFG